MTTDINYLFEENTMANIAISDLHPVGANLFEDSESFMMDLSDDQLDVKGGATPVILTIVVLTLIPQKAY
ncbi:hypothetical protein [Moorena sp. SIO3I6]|uniref:hypothetical protein n=1 Tax=Moorena sp. SIO3I6 TaxID=2607831 RepID=UPI0013FB03E0|nr:hypothetical protein [Moorena sp. SIO3I6]NEP28094.1 hypothetical protein [Moorena sp. SIO3I6]